MDPRDALNQFTAMVAARGDFMQLAQFQSRAA
jgi:hypothetical protein